MEMRSVGRTATESHRLCYSSLFPPSNNPRQFLSFSPPKPQRVISSPARSRSSPSIALFGARMSAIKLEPSLALKDNATKISNELKGTSIFLVGINCTIKTNMGQLLADALRYYYFDSDSVVEQAFDGVSASESFRIEDEQGFRDSETEVLKQLSSMGRLVVCAGDGAVQNSVNLSYLRYGISVWIDVPLDLLPHDIQRTEIPLPLAQVESDSDPFSELLQELSKRYNEMKGGYGTADSIVSLQKLATQKGYEDFYSVTPEDMALEVLKEIEKLMRVKKMMEAAARPF